MAHKFDHRRNLPDDRDLYVEAPNAIGVEALPKSYDVWEFSTEIPRWDQGQEGSCGPHAKSRASQKTAMDLGVKFDESDDDRESPAFSYYTTRQLQGTTNQDSGVSNRELFQAHREFGYCHEAEMPYSAGDYTKAPSEDAYNDGAKHKGSTYRTLVPGHGTMRTQLASGNLIVAGFSVPEWFEDENQWNPAAEPLPIPTPDVKYIGGHDVCLTGYDFSLTQFRVPVFYADNSWGDEWGQPFQAKSGTAGRFAFDYRWFARNLCYDLTIITKEN